MAEPSADRARAARRAALRLMEMHPAIRQERLSGIHNPWGVPAGLTDAWAFLDVCESAAVTQAAAAIIGPDLVLWDSELFYDPAAYVRFAQGGREGRWWPADPCAGAVVLVTLGEAPAMLALALEAAALVHVPPSGMDAPLLVIRIMPAASRYRREPRHEANWRAMRERPLVNYATRPLWLVGGVDVAGNDFVTGFAPVAPRWAGPMELGD